MADTRDHADPTKWSARRNAPKLRLQKPDWVFFAGSVRPWEEAILHASSEAVLRGLNVFEGLKGYWQPAGSFGFVHLERHWARLTRSARLLHIPVPITYEDFKRACFDLTRTLYRPENDLYLRATLVVVEGHYGLGTVADLVVMGYQMTKDAPAPVDMGVSTWRRPTDDAMPTRIKTGSNYQVARLARIEGEARGYADMILLNQSGRVAESTGACVLVVRDGRVSTPLASEGALESITVDVVGEIAKSLKLPFERRTVDRTELYIADELGLAGTLAEITPVKSLDEHRFAEEQTVLTLLAKRYRDAVKGLEAHPAIELAVMP